MLPTSVAEPLNAANSRAVLDVNDKVSAFANTLR